jgi:hypothetical protein
MKKAYVLLATVLVIICFTTSCKKQRQDKLEDTWQLVKISRNTPANLFELWDFSGGNFTRLTQQVDSISILDTIDSGNYSVEGGLFSPVIKITDCSEIIYNGDWKVRKLKSNIMIILNDRDNLFLYREFVKYQ